MGVPLRSTPGLRVSRLKSKAVRVVWTGANACQSLPTGNGYIVNRLGIAYAIPAQLRGKAMAKKTNAKCPLCGDTGVKAVGVDASGKIVLRVRCDCPKGQRKRKAKQS